MGPRFSAGSRMSTRLTPEQGLQQIPESAVLQSSGHRQFEIPGFRMFVTPLLHRIKIPEFCTFANSRLRRFQASENREFPAPENMLRELCQTQRFEGDGFVKGVMSPILIMTVTKSAKNALWLLTYDWTSASLAPPLKSS
jgi:hypothetical protein